MHDGIELGEHLDRLAQRFVAASTAALSLVLGGCALDSADESDEALDEPLKNHGSPQWIYEGLLPQLEDAFIHISAPVHTVRVTGYLPDWFVENNERLPFYAKADIKNGRRRITVVYPTATGVLPYHPPSYGFHPSIEGYAYYPSTNIPWGGFPYLEYDHDRSIAMHGPITTEGDPGTKPGDGDWELIRGNVSHGCNRMAGEHVVELAHLIGLNMRKTHAINPHDPLNPGASFAKTLEVPVTVLDKPDVWDGHPVDVAYPANPEVLRPEGPDVAKFKTWIADTFPRFVCAYNPKRALNKHHCDYMGPNKKDPITGKAP